MYRKRSLKTLFLFIILVIVIHFSFAVLYPGHAKTTAEDHSRWAAAIQKNGLPNFYKVSDTLYRGAQPTQEGFMELKKMGIKTIINLRKFHTDEKLINGMGFNYVQIPSATNIPDKEKYLKFLKIVRNPEMQPVFVHCNHGADRTGTAAALYRINIQGWDTEEAIRELQQGGYGYHSLFQKMIRFIRSFNSE